MKKRHNNLMMLVVIFVLALTACANNQPAATPPAAEPVAGDGVMAEGKLKPVQAANLSFQVRGMVQEINVKIGDQVKKGEVLARLANFDQAMAQLTGANFALLQAQNDYDQQ